jgi:hypothetical protein
MLRNLWIFVEIYTTINRLQLPEREYDEIFFALSHTTDTHRLAHVNNFGADVYYT